MSKVDCESCYRIKGLEVALEGALALVKSLKLQNDNLRAANEAKHREIADMDRRHVDAVYKLQCHIRELEDGEVIL